MMYYVKFLGLFFIVLMIQVTLLSRSSYDKDKTNNNKTGNQLLKSKEIKKEIKEPDNSTQLSVND